MWETSKYKRSMESDTRYVCVRVCVCVFSSHSFWTSSSLDVPAGVTQEEGHTGFFIHLPSAVRALIFFARRIQPSLFSLVDREVEFCVLTISSFSTRWAFFFFFFFSEKNPVCRDRTHVPTCQKVTRLPLSYRGVYTMCMPPPRTPRTMVRIEAAGEIYKQVQSFTYLGGAVTETPDMSVEIARRTPGCWTRIRRYSRELYSQPKVALFLKTRMVKAEEIEVLLYGCSTWTLRQEHYAKLRTVHHRVLLRIIGAQRKRPDHRMTSYNRALEITGCESIETTLRTRRLLWAGTLLRMSGGRLPKRIMFGNLEGAVRKGRGGKEKEWTDCVQSDIRAFGITGDWEMFVLEWDCLHPYGTTMVLVFREL